MTEILKGNRVNNTTAWVDVRDAKTARLEAVLMSGDAASCVLTIEDSADSEHNGTLSAVTLGSIGASPVQTTPFDVDGVSFIRARITTASSSDSMIRVTIGVQKEV